jgi:putative membrane protein
MLSALALAAAAPAVLAQSSPQDKRAQSSQSQTQKKASLSKQDQQHFRDMAQASLAEVETGKLAEQQASSNNVKVYARHMVTEHGRMLEEQEQMAGDKGMQMPKQPKKEHQAALQKLKKAKGEEFDRAYMSQMVKDHEKTLKLVQQTAKSAKDPELKAMAQKAEPTIKEHLQQAKELSDKASAGATKARK